MKISCRTGCAWLALFALGPATISAETRMQVSAGSTPVYTQPSGNAQQVGHATSGEILFVSRIDGDWAAISPPDRLDLWLNKDFIEGNRVVAKSIQIRSGPGIQFDVVGMLERGAPVMPRGEEGDWCKIAPPSSTTLWVKKSDLSEVQTHTTAIREVVTAANPEPVPPAPVAKAEAPPAPPPPAQTPEVVPQLAAQPAPPAPAKVAPSVPQAPAPEQVQRLEPAPAAPAPSPVASAATPPRPVTETVRAPAAPVAKPPAAPRPVPRPAVAPAVAAPGHTPPPATPTATGPRPAPPARRPAQMPAAAKSVPAPASAVAAQKSKNLEMQVDPQLVEDLDLAEGMPNQGKAVQVEGELRNAPFLTASPSRYRLLSKDEDGRLEMACHVHGDSEILRQYIGKGVSIRGREYWVDTSDMPVVVVGQIVPLAPANEPVMF